MENYQDIEVLKSNLDSILEERKSLIQSALRDIENDYKDSLSIEELHNAKEWIKELNNISHIEKDESLINNVMDDVSFAMLHNYSLDDINKEYIEFVSNYDSYNEILYQNWIKNSTANDAEEFEYSNIRDDLNFLYINNIKFFHGLGQIKNISNEKYNQLIQELNINENILDKYDSFEKDKTSSNRRT
ncbi:hypothetical protein [Mycoplasma sp. 2634B]|uniref:hypothetical protein n=1 Tax=Mycoplasma sp. 2634B TaxID=3401692 RepID=UPI003AAB5244